MQMQERRKLSQGHKSDAFAIEASSTPDINPPSQSSGMDRPPRARKVSPDTGTSHGTQDITASERPKREKTVTPSVLKNPHLARATPRPDDDPQTSPRQDQSPQAQKARDPQTTDEAPGTGWEAAPARRPRWEERYTRVTWYVENQRLHRVREQCQGTGRSLTNIVNDALEQYLKGRHHH